MSSYKHDGRHQMISVKQQKSFPLCVINSCISYEQKIFYLGKSNSLVKTKIENVL